MSFFGRSKGKETDKNPPIKTSSSESTSGSSQYGITVLAKGVDPVVDIVAVHGLNGHRETTWTVNGVNWLSDFLPSKIPNARILSWGYDANTHNAPRFSADYLHDHGMTLVLDLWGERDDSNTSTRPIIFVAHSLGGLVVKSALIHSSITGKRNESIFLSTHGILFLGTPHQGVSAAELGALLLRVTSIFGTNTRIIENLTRNSEIIQLQLIQYGSISRGIVTKFAYETYATPLPVGGSKMVVPKTSAVVQGLPDADIIPIPANHLDMVKFTTKDELGYIRLSRELKSLAETAPLAVSERWAKHTAEQASVKQDFSVPFSLSGVPEVQEFVGRKEELMEIKETFQGNGSQRKVVILHGLGGIGKTQLAVASIKEHRDIYSAIFWLNGKNEDTLKQSFADMAKRLRNKHPSSPLLRRAVEEKDINQVVAALKQWFSQEGNTHWILVFDNVDNPRLPDINDAQAYDVSSYFPETHQGSILVTTRSSRLLIGKVINVTKLVDIQESIMILASTSGRKDIDQDGCVIELVKKIDGLPLALATAGAYLRKLAMSVEDYLIHYQVAWKELQETSSAFSSYQDRTIVNTWNLSFQYIQKQNPSAEKLLRLWAYFDNEDLWFELFAAGRKDSPEWFANIVKNKLSFNAVIRLLCDHALIEAVNITGGYSMHTCVHAWVVHMLNANRETSMARLALNCVGSAVPRVDTPEYMTIRRRLLPHALRCSELIYCCIDVQTPDNWNIYQAIYKLGYLYSDMDKMQEAKNMYELALKGFKQSEKSEHNSVRTVQNSLGALYASQGKMQEAEDMYNRALPDQIIEDTITDIITLDVLNNLASLYLDQRKLHEAENMYTQVLKGKEEVCGRGHTSTLAVIHNLGHVYHKKGQMQDAENMFRRALECYEELFGLENTLVLDILNSLGTLYLDQEKMKEAEDMFCRALKGSNEVRGPETTPTLRIVHNLALLYTKQGQLRRAKTMYLEALDGFEKVWGPEHIWTLDIVGSLANFYKSQGNMQNAEAMYLRVLEGKKNAWGAEHPLTLDTFNDFAGCLKSQGKLQEAEAMYLDVLNGNEKVRGEEHVSTLMAVNNLGVVYLNQGKMSKAETMYIRALKGFENALGKGHSSTLETTHNLGVLYLRQDKLQDAETILLQAMKGKTKAWGEGHPSTLDTVNTLGHVYAFQGNLQDAEGMYLRSLKGKEKALGPEHISTKKTFNTLLDFYKNQDKREEAEAMFQRALQGSEES